MLLFSFIALLLTTLSDPAFAQKKKYEFAKERKMSQSYNAASGDKLVISNTFGNVVIKTWSQREVKVDIQIAISSTKKENAENLFDRIHIDHGKKGNEISFVTDMHNEKSPKDGTGNVSNTIDIDYTVSMPADLELELRNKFGDIILPDLKGKVKVVSQFGKLQAGKLDNVASIDVRHGNANIESAANGSYSFQFASEARIRNLDGDADIRIQHCKSNGVVIHLGSNAGDLKVNGQHSDLALVVNKNLSANFDVKTHFGSFQDNAGFGIKSKEDEESSQNSSRRYGQQATRFNKKYTGTAGGGKSKINISGNFTDISVGFEAPKAKPKKTGTSGKQSSSGRKIIKL